MVRGEGAASLRGGTRLGAGQRAVRAVALGVMVSGVFVASATLGLLAHLDLPATRRVVRDTVNGVFAGLFDGRIRLGDIETLSLDGLRVARFQAFAPNGDKVIDVEDVRLRGRWLGSVLGLLGRGGTGRLSLGHLRVERGFVGLTIEEGKPLPLAEAFGTGPPSAAPEPSPRRPFLLELDTIELGEVRVAGTLAPSVPIDATVSRLRARLRVGQGGIDLDVDRSSLSERALAGAPIRGSADYHLRGEFDADPEGRRLAMWGTFGGHLGELQLLVNGLLRDGELVASVDLPRVGEEEIARWAPALSVARPLSARLGLRGQLSSLDLTGLVELPGVAGAPGGQVQISGVMTASDRVTLAGRVDVEGFDARLFGADLPTTRLSLTAQTSVALSGADTALHVALDGRPSRWADHPIPPVSGVIEVAGGQATARLAVGEPGAATDVYLRYDASYGLSFASRSQVPSLARVPRLAALLGPTRLGGRASLRTEGRYGSSGELDVYAEAETAGLTMPSADVVVGGGRAVARLRGSTQQPGDMRLEASVSGGGSTLAGRPVERFRFSAVGPLAHPTVEAEVVDRARRRLSAKAVADPAAGQLRALEVQVEAGRASLAGKVDRVGSIGDALAIDGLELSGLGGEVRGELVVDRGELIGELEATGLELRDLSRMLGVAMPLRGTANVSVDLQRAEGGRRGHVQVRMVDAGLLLLDGLDLSLDSRFEGERVEAEAALALINPLRQPQDHPCAGNVATITLEDVQTSLGGPLLRAETWEQANVAGTLGLESAQLRCLAEIWQQASPLTAIPVSEIAGVIDASVGLARVAGNAYPSITHLGLKTTGLVVAGRPAEPADEPPWKSDALDLAVVGGLDGQTGLARLSVALLDDDRRTSANLARPPLVRLDATMDLDLDALARGGAEARRSLERAEASMALETTRSPFSRWAALPAPWRDIATKLGGEVEVDLYMEGTARDPSLAGRARVWGLSRALPEGERWHVQNDLDFIATYQGGQGRVDGTLHRDGELVAELSGESEGNLSARLIGGTDARWTGWLRTELEGLELSTLPRLGRLGLRGAVTGHAEVRGLGESPRASINLRVPVLGVGSRLRFQRASVIVEPVDDGSGTMSLQVELPLVRSGKSEGLLRIAGYGGLDWERLLYPKPALDRSAGLYVVADRFPVAAFRPFVGEGVAGLGGRLDGELRVGYKESATREVSVDMDMYLRDGAVQLVTLGQEVHGVQAHLRAGGGLLRVDDLELRSGTGRARGSVRAGLEGLGVNVITGSVQIDEAEPFPVASEGVPLGQVTGRIDTNISIREDEIDALVVTRDLRLRLPPSANRDVQDLTPHPDVAIAQPLRAPDRDRPEGEAGEEVTLPVKLTIVLSPTEIVGNQLRIAFLTESPLHVRSGGAVRGEIVVTGGELTVLDKTFRVDRGTVLLREEAPGNPYLNVTAHWDAPDGTTVYVDYIGPLKPMQRESFSFRSNPPRPESEVLALLIFGDANAGATATDQTNTVANSVAAAQFNAVLGQLAPGLSTKVSTNSATLTYQLTDSLTVSATFENQQNQGAVSQEGNTESNSPGAAPSDASQRSELSVDWRFAKRWLLRGTVGVGIGATSGLELLFQHRY